MKKTTVGQLGTSTKFATAESSANYAELAAQLIIFLKNRVRPIDALEFKKDFGELSPNQRVRLFLSLVKRFSLKPTETNNIRKKYSDISQRYIFDVELRNSLAERLTPERVEILCLTGRVFCKPGRKNPKEEALIQERINVLLGDKVVADGDFHPEAATLSEIVPDLTPMPEENPAIISEEQELLDLRKQLDALQEEVARKQAALDKKTRLIKTGKEIIEMFNISVEDLKEIINLL